MKVAVVGAGAIGGLVGAHLWRAGHEVILVDRDEEHVKTMHERGLRISGATEFLARPPVLTPEEMPEELGVVLLAVKSRHTEDAMSQIAPRLSADGYVVSLQNGLEEYKIAAAVGASRTVGAFLTFGGHYLRPGEIVYGGPGSFRIGELDGTPTERVEQLAQALAVFHPAEPTSNIFGYLLGKEALGAFYFATALVSEDVPLIIDRLRYRLAFSRLVGEVVSVATAEGIVCEAIDGFDARVLLKHATDGELTEPSWSAQKRYWAGHVQGRTGVWRDLAIHHRPTEADHILAPIVARAANAGLAVPRLATVLDLVHQVERGERELGWANLERLLEVDQASA